MTATHPFVREFCDTEEWQERLNIAGAVCRPVPSIYIMLICCFLDSATVPASSGAAMHSYWYYIRRFAPLGFVLSGLWYRAANSTSFLKNPRTKGLQSPIGTCSRLDFDGEAEISNPTIPGL